MKNFFLLLCFLFLLTNCTQNPFAKKEKKPTFDGQDYFNICILGGIIQGFRKEISIVDNQDGTITLAELDVFGNSLCRTRTNVISKPLFVTKKCIQGQVYRKAQNDCKGTGTASNYYGAVKMQYCNIQNGCNDANNLPYPFVSCQTEKYRTYNLLIIGPRSLQPRNLIPIYTDRVDEIPTTLSDYYWEGDRLTNFKSELMANQTHTEFGYVLCGIKL
jgi:hypothetical protein